MKLCLSDAGRFLNDGGASGDGAGAGDDTIGGHVSRRERFQCTDDDVPEGVCLLTCYLAAVEKSDSTSIALVCILKDELRDPRKESLCRS